MLDNILRSKYLAKKNRLGNDGNNLWRDVAYSLLPLGNVSKDNYFNFYFDGDAIQDMWESMSKAKVRIWVQCYLLASDYVGLTTISKLTEAANRGCNVVLVFDQRASSIDYSQLNEINCCRSHYR